MSEVISCKEQLAQLQKENETHAKGIASGLHELELLRKENAQLEKNMSDQNDSEKHLQRQHDELRDDVVMLKKRPHKAESPKQLIEAFRKGLIAWLQGPEMGTECTQGDPWIKNMLQKRLEIKKCMGHRPGLRRVAPATGPLVGKENSA